MALEQHLGDAGHSAEIAVDLERRMEVPEIRQRAHAYKVRVELMGSVPVSGARP